jgi:hypothetical protein
MALGQRTMWTNFGGSFTPIEQRVRHLRSGEEAYPQSSISPDTTRRT